MAEMPVQITGLTHRYGGAEEAAVEGLDVEVGPGEIVGLLGPNGAGKTTTLHTVLGLLEPTAGRVLVFGHSPLTERTEVLRRLNFASVDVDLPSNLLVQECLRIFAGLYTAPDSEGRIKELTQRFELGSLLRQRVGTLSAGEHMRVKLCKAMLNAPQLLVLDEPTLSLDPYRAQQVRDSLKALQRERGMSILHTSHNMREVETFCDRIVFLHRGRKLAEGPPAAVLEQTRSRSLDELFIRVATSGDLVELP
jgi:ABC-2 type transport system ATP-binding protein